MLENFDQQGHRGSRGLMPENTIVAMIRALDLGVTTLEMDVSFSADSLPLLSHEPFFNHEITTKPDGSIINEKEERTYNLFRMPYSEIVKYDVGLKPNPRFPKQEKMKVHKPLLADVIDSVENHIQVKKLKPVFYNIETKTTPETDNVYHPVPSAFVDRIMQVIDQKKIRDKVIIQSFDIRTLQYLHQYYPGLKTSLLIEPSEMITSANKIKKLGFNPDVLSPEYRMVDENLIKDVHQKNMKIIPWTVNDSATIVKLKSMGVDGIITDYPDLFK